MDDTGKSNSSEEDKFKVTVSVGDKDQKCSVIKADAVFVKNHKQVFGPASLEECEKWLRENHDCPKKENTKNAPGDEGNNSQDI